MNIGANIAMIDFTREIFLWIMFTQEVWAAHCIGAFSCGLLSFGYIRPRLYIVLSRLDFINNRENAVTSCRTCNGRKGSLTVDRLKSVGMKLSRRPRVPTQFQLHSVATKMLPSRVHPTWAPYLGVEADVQTFQKPDEQQQAMYFEDIS